jgi:hypothetical protein
VRSYQIAVDGQEYSVQIDNPDASIVTVQVNGRVFRVAVKEPSAAGRSPSAASEADMPDMYVPVVAATYVEVEPEADTLTARAPA